MEWCANGSTDQSHLRMWHLLRTGQNIGQARWAFDRMDMCAIKVFSQSRSSVNLFLPPSLSLYLSLSLCVSPKNGEKMHVTFDCSYYIYSIFCCLAEGAWRRKEEFTSSVQRWGGGWGDEGRKVRQREEWQVRRISRGGIRVWGRGVWIWRWVKHTVMDRTERKDKMCILDTAQAIPNSNHRGSMFWTPVKILTLGLCPRKWRKKSRSVACW
jgi:hypothetical protein